METQSISGTMQALTVSERMMQSMFETFNMPARYVAIQAALLLYASIVMDLYG